MLHCTETPTISKETVLADTKVDRDDTEQPTLREILWAVNKCTDSVNTLKDHFDSLREQVTLLHQEGYCKMHQRHCQESTVRVGRSTLRS